MRPLIIASLLAIITGCGHSSINYSPAPRQGVTWDRAVSIIERGFYEDYGDQKAQSVSVTNKAIVIADGLVTKGVHSATAVPVYGAAIVMGSSTAKTVAAGQHIYLDSLQPSIVVKRNGRDNRYAVIVRATPGITARRVFFREERRAKEFADALEYVHQTAITSGAGGAPASNNPSRLMTQQQYKRMKLDQLMKESLPYEEYTRRAREIEAQ